MPRKVSKENRNDLRRGQLLAIFDRGMWMQTAKCLYHIPGLRHMDVDFLTYLIELSSMIHINGKREFDGVDDWFYFKKERIRRQINMSFEQQRDSFARLVKGGFILTRWAGMPAKRYVWVDTDAIMDAVEGVLGPDPRNWLHSAGQED